MTANLTFVDTNVLVYAYDPSAGQKHVRAKEVVNRIWQSGDGAVSTQVLQEFYVTITKKGRHPMSVNDGRRFLERYRAWEVHSISLDDILMASELAEHSKLSFWDALIVQSAIGCGASRLLTEDMQSGLKINQLTLENPFTN